MARSPDSSAPTYIWQHAGWPGLTFDEPVLAPLLDAARLEQGRLLGQLEAIGFGGRQEAARELWSGDALATAAIEGERLDLNAVRSSVGHRLGLDVSGSRDRHVDGLVELMEDATANFEAPLSKERLGRWQTALFPGGASGVRRIAVGRWRDHADPMEIVSGPIGREVVHYRAPASRDVDAQMRKFLAWFEASRPPAKDPRAQLHGLVRAAIAHLWFETVHPFEDGNGRVGRAIADLAIAQDLGSPQRVFSLSRQIMASRGAYYDALNAAQRGGLNVTPWVAWFVQAFTAGCVQSQAVVSIAIAKAAFRQRMALQALNARQRKVLERLLEAGDGGFLGGMTAEKYGKLTGAAKATATRDLSHLLQNGLLVVEGSGKSTRYAVAVEGWNRPGRMPAGPSASGAGSRPEAGAQ